MSQNKCETQPSTATVQLCRVMEKHSSALTCVRFSNNGLYIASSGLDKTAVIWETVKSVFKILVNYFLTVFNFPSLLYPIFFNNLQTNFRVQERS